MEDKKMPNYVTQMSKDSGNAYLVKDAAARQQISNEVTARESAIASEVTARESAIAAEATARESAIASEVTARESAIAAEATARESAIATEASTREAEISELKSAITNNSHTENYSTKGKGQTTLYMQGLFTFIENGYFDRNGITQHASAHRIMLIEDPSIRKIVIPQYPQAVDGGLPSVMVKNGNTIVKMYAFEGNTSDNEITIPDVNFTSIYINWWSANTNPWYTAIEVNSIWNVAGIGEIVRNGYGIKSWYDYLGQTVIIPFENNYLMRDGYLDGSPYFHANGTVHKNLLIPAKYVKKISISGNNAPGVPYVYRYKNETASGSALIGEVQEGEWSTDYPKDVYGGMIGINYFRDKDGTYAHEVTIEFFDKRTVEEYDPYDHMIQKPLDFNGQNAIFVGDSITVGHTDGIHVTPNNYVKGFCEKVGLNYENKAVAGALFVSGLNEVKTIPAQVAEITTPPDYLFIAGGVNDWSLGADFREFKNTIKALCDYIAENLPDTKVIWITPVSTAKTESAIRNLPSFTFLQTYRNMIFEMVTLKYRSQYSIVDGTKIGFPEKDAPLDTIEAMYGDRLHPSELGYNALYVPGLLTALQ
jgi:lysophospholipase L1-like esterase